MFNSFNQENTLCSFVHVRDDDIVEADSSFIMQLVLDSTLQNDRRVIILPSEAVVIVEDNDSMCSAVVYFVLLYYVHFI